MTIVGYHASHEQHRPSRLIEYVRQAEDAGFTAASSSDHFTPWSRSQGQSGFAWAWLGAALANTRLPFGVVNAPGQRYHPAIIAQAIATLAEMYPDRLWVAMGSGEASNEHITGDRWPPKAQRNERLLECVDVVRSLLRGEEVSVDGHVRVDRARLWSLPDTMPTIIGAALSVETAGWCGGWADGMITVHQPLDRLRAMIGAFRDGGGAGKPVYLQVKVAWAADEADALTGAFDQWRTNVFDAPLMADLEQVEQFEIAATHVRPDDLRDHVLVSSDLGQHAAWLHEFLGAGVDALFIHQVPKPQEAFIDAFGAKVLPEVTA
jgi:probable non-F420 flavinoid oxidoreductase